MNCRKTKMQHAPPYMKTIPVSTVFPHWGRAQKNPKSPPLQPWKKPSASPPSNPTLRPAEAEIRASKARQQHPVCYLPNPQTVGYTAMKFRRASSRRKQASSSSKRSSPPAN